MTLAQTRQKDIRPVPVSESLPVLPHNLAAEQSILGAILLDNHALNTAVERLRAEDFFLPQHRYIFERMIDLGQRQQGIDLVTVVEDLSRTGHLDAAGGAAYVSQLADGLPRVTNVQHYARIVKEKAVLRNLAFKAEAIRGRALAADDDADVIVASAQTDLAQIPKVSAHAWRAVFHAYDDFENAPPLRMAIKNLVPLDAATAIGALAGHGKTWLLMSIVKAMLKGRGTMLWNHFEVVAYVPRVVYLIPESALGPFTHRLRTLGLFPFLKSDRLLVRTLSMGPKPVLSDPRILAAAKGSFVVLDTLARFTSGDENSADEFQVLANDIFALMAAGAEGVAAAHHAPKSFAGANTMSLEAILRGTGDIGAVFATVFGMKQIDVHQNILQIQNVKARDFAPLGPFQLIGRPNLDHDGDFGMLKAPGDCGELADEQRPERDRGGAPESAREARAANLALMRSWLEKDRDLTSRELVQRFVSVGIKLNDSSIRHYRRDLRV
jgi:hypothetical protein